MMPAIAFPRIRHALAVLLVFAACATPGPDTLAEIERIRPDAKVRLGTLTSPAEVSPDIDAKSLLREALASALSDAGLAASAAADDAYVLDLEIVEYEPGNAFKRWLLPFYGGTILRVHGELIDPQRNAVAARIDHQRSVLAGGAYSIGAWRSIFDSVARDIVRDLRAHTKGEGFFVSLEPWAARDLAVPQAPQPRRFVLEPFVDRRAERGRIGERTAAFGVSMGDIHFARDVAEFLRETVADDLRAAGHEVDYEDRPHVASAREVEEEDTAGIAGGEAGSIRGEVLDFTVRTDTTALYWDVVAEIELGIRVLDPADASELTAPKSSVHRCSHTERTYLYPTKAVVVEALDGCLEDLMQDLRRAPELLDFRP